MRRKQTIDNFTEGAAKSLTEEDKLFTCKQCGSPTANEPTFEGMKDSSFCNDCMSQVFFRGE